MLHDDCSQSSDEEGLRVKLIYESLLQQHWIDRDGAQRRIGVADILVVSPYNVQFNYLRSLLAPGVGTVDKFQGQEAPVVLLSMATSCAEDSRLRLGSGLAFFLCLGIPGPTWSCVVRAYKGLSVDARCQSLSPMPFA